jgi:hypothetical protein
MATFTAFTSLNSRRSLLQFSLEALTCGLARQRANERTERSICGVIGLCGIPCLRASAPPPAAFRSWSSSFGHDTPAHSERRCRCCSR